MNPQRNVIEICLLCAVTLFASIVTHAQGTMTCLSNLGQTAVGSLAVGSNSWLAVAFETGTNAAGYTLDSIQLEMTNGSGDPNGFTVMICNLLTGTTVPLGNLGTLGGSLDPTNGGIFTYSPASNLTLRPAYLYYIVVTAGTAVADGAYEWSYANANSYNPSGGWSNPASVLTSSSGIYASWTSATGYPEFAIKAIPIPEPGVLGLFGLAGLVFLWHRQKAKA